MIDATAPPDRDRAPFSHSPDASPQSVAKDLVECFESLARVDDPMTRALEACIIALGADRGSPLCRGATAIAADIDRGIGAGVPHGYHNSAHLLEVTLCAFELAHRAGLRDDAAILLLVAAVIHDFHHDGTIAVPSSFRLEALAIREATPYLAAAQVDRSVLARIETLVLATEPAAGVPFARACHGFHCGGRDSAPPAPLPQLEALRADRLLALQAVALVEADVLPSIGLTVEHSHRMHDRLATEWGRPLGPEDKIRFIDDVFGELQVGAFFMPNVQALRADCLQRLVAG